MHNKINQYYNSNNGLIVTIYCYSDTFDYCCQKKDNTIVEDWKMGIENIGMIEERLNKEGFKEL